MRAGDRLGKCHTIVSLTVTEPGQAFKGIFSLFSPCVRPSPQAPDSELHRGIKWRSTEELVDLEYTGFIASGTSWANIWPSVQNAISGPERERSALEA